MHHKEITDVIKELDVDINSGLDSQEISKRQKLYGLNEINLAEESNLKIIVRQFLNPLVIILIIASIIALIFGEYKDFIFILIILVINGIIGSIQEIQAKSKIHELLKLSKPRSKVIRNGQIVTIQNSEITVGDVLILNEGDIVGADARLIDSNNLTVDESILTGESLPISKFADKILEESTPIYERENTVFGSTIVLKGTGKAIVYAIGQNTESGKIYSKSKSKEGKTPLIKAIDNFSKKLIIIVVSIMLFIFIIGISQGRDYEDIFLLILAQLVSAIPEGLPIAITIALVVGSLILLKKKTLIRYLPAVEALGSTTFICTDKTGTLTENRLTVEHVITDENNITNLIFTLCNDSTLEHGDPLDIALLRYLRDKGIDIDEIRSKYTQKWFFPFDTKLKLMASINDIDGRNYLFIKGAFETISNITTNKKDLEKYKFIHDQMTEQGLRVIAFGYKEIDYIPENLLDEEIKLIGLVGFVDPPKKDAADAIKDALNSGVNIMMITGDNLNTALKIASDVGIHTKEKLFFEGKDLSKYDDTELYELLKKTSVIARAIPDDKHRIVSTLQKHSETVAVMGDGVNDIPAIKSANLGIAVDTASEATKSVSRMILRERNISVIVDAIYIGRQISHNIRKVIGFLLSTNIGEIFFLGTAMILNFPQPLFPTQILWINLVTDGITDKTLVLTKEERWIRSLSPKIFNTWFLDKSQILKIISFALFITVINILILHYLVQSISYEQTVTVIFLCMVAAQWAFAIQSIREKPFFSNPLENFKINPYIYLAIIFIGIPLHIIAYLFFPDVLHMTQTDIDLLIFYPLLVFVMAFAFLEILKVLMNIKEEKTRKFQNII
ncbi:MAG: cation-transporting P-type ATPase [Candidatus Dojkabacteria bacterium]|nr:cation-transporting P-type ATPase [Candidatus Dojkabacteria bacterium]